MKLLIKIILLFSLMSFASLANAEEHPFVAHFAHKLKIKLSKDGTGIVKDVTCTGCTFKIVNITRNSKAYKNGAEVSILEARSRAGKPTVVSFNTETREVQAIRWTDKK
jgi:hypothetical protein